MKTPDIIYFRIAPCALNNISSFLYIFFSSSIKYLDAWANCIIHYQYIYQFRSESSRRLQLRINMHWVDNYIHKTNITPQPFIEIPVPNKDNNKITENRAIFQRERLNSWVNNRKTGKKVIKVSGHVYVC